MRGGCILAPSGQDAWEELREAGALRAVCLGADHHQVLFGVLGLLGLSQRLRQLRLWHRLGLLGLLGGFGLRLAPRCGDDALRVVLV
jgi:hypothetical protein